MNGRERITAALRGEPVDRVPIWLREGFPTVNGPADADDFQRGWQADPLYRDLFDCVAPHVDSIEGFGGFPQNRWLMVPWKYISGETVEDTPRRRVHRTTIRTPRGDLHDVTEVTRGHATTWHRKPMVESLDELAMLAEVPHEMDREALVQLAANVREANERTGDLGVTRAFLSSPVVCISGAMPFELFLELSVTERGLFHELCEEVTRRYLSVLEAWFAVEEPDTTFCFGGSEQCTPPMMAPRTYDEYVLPYEGRLIRWLKERGKLVAVHCHGKVAHALQGMMEAGADATDPVEPPPAGDVTYEQARAIAGDRLTLMGNLEWDRLEAAEPAEIREHVRGVLSHGNRRLILGASAGPISAVTPRLAANYRAWVDTALEFGS